MPDTYYNFKDFEPFLVSINGTEVMQKIVSIIEVVKKDHEFMFPNIRELTHRLSSMDSEKKERELEALYRIEAAVEILEYLIQIFKGEFLAKKEEKSK